MEKRLFGILLTILGIAGLIAAAWYFVNSGTGTRAIKAIIVFGLLGAIFFAAGIGLIRNTKDNSY